MRWRALAGDDRGLAMPFVAVSSIALVAAAAFAVDVGYLYATHAKLQATADAASLAAVLDLPSVPDARATGVHYGSLNYPDGGAVVVASDVIPGRWDPDSRTFDAWAEPYDAVEVTAKRAASNGNPLDLLFAPVLGDDRADVGATAVSQVAKSVLDFEDGLSPGDQPAQISWGHGISGGEVPGYVTVTGPGFGPMIFDATCGGIGPPLCSGGDNDLYQPAQGNVLIISEDGDADDPDDEAAGGIIVFDFSNFGAGSVTVGSLVLIDAEEGGTATLYRDGEVVDTVALGGVSDGEKEVRFVSEVTDVDLMTIELHGSGAVDDIGYSTVVHLVD